MRARRDGNDVVPIRSGSRLSIPAAAGGLAGRSSTIELDYVMETAPMADGSVLHPDRPRLELPCLSFTWEVAIPAGWRAIDPGPGLVGNDPGDPAGWPCGVLGLGMPGWPSGRGLGGPDAAERLHQLGRPELDSLSFAEWFSRWDSGPWPIVVDRLALSSAGLGPKSSCVPGRSAADRRDPARAMLQQHGLAVVAFPDALLITTEAESSRFNRQGPWLDSIAEVLAWGSDRTDRFQSVDRWRGETSPRGASAADEGNERTRRLPGRLVWRFSAPDWPEADAFVHLEDGHRRLLMGWVIAGVLVMAWLGAARLGPASRLLLPVAVAAACVLLERILPSRYGAATAGGFVAALAILIGELAQEFERRPSRSERPSAARVVSCAMRPAPRPCRP